MKKLCSIAAAAALLLLVGSRALAGGCGCDCCCECPLKPSPDHTYLELTFKPTVMTVTTEKLVEKEFVKPVKVCECVPVWEERKKTVCEYHKVAREIEKEVVSCRLVPECTCDPCTGCTKICYRKETCVHKVKCCVWDCVPVQKVVTEKVCTMKTVEKTVLQKCCVRELVEEVKQENVILVGLAPYHGKIAPPPCPAPAPLPPAKPCCGH
jgi:hypothetical protein